MQLDFLALLHSVLVSDLLFVFLVVFVLLFKTVAVTTAAVKSNRKISKYFFITHRLDY